jgi:hypothetical protein
MLQCISSSPQRLEAFLKSVLFHELRELRLVYDCPTRWNSVYDMLSRALYLKNAIAGFLEKDAKLKHLKLSEEDWDKGEVMLAILRPFKTASIRLQATSKPGIDKVFYYYESLFDDIDKIDVHIMTCIANCRTGCSVFMIQKNPGFTFYEAQYVQ